MRNDLAAKLGTANWPMRPLWSLVTRVDRKNSGLAETNLLSLSYGRIVRKSMESVGGLRPGSYETYNRVEPGDIVLRMTDLQNDQKSIRTGLVTESGIITSAYVTLRPDPELVEPRFLAAALRAYDAKKVFYEMGSGVRQNLTYSELGELPIPLPDATVQQTIADHIDSELRDLDSLLTDVVALQQLLVERRSALITDIVTGRKDVTL